MKNLQVTKLEAQVLEALAGAMYAEPGYSDYGPSDLVEDLGIEIRVLRGVLGSLGKKGYLYTDDRKTEGYKNQPDMHICYLQGDAVGLVEHWVGESLGWDENDIIEEAKIVIG